MANSALEPVSESTLRAPFQYQAHDGTWHWRHQLAPLRAHEHLGLARKGEMRWGEITLGWDRFWNRLMRALTKEGASNGHARADRTDIGPAHRWYFCYVLRPAIGAALDALRQEPSSTLARVAASFLHPGNDEGVWALYPTARAFFLELQYMEPYGTPPSTTDGGVWYRPSPPLDYTSMPVQQALTTVPPAGRLYTVLFEEGRKNGDCTVWTAAVLVWFTYNVLLTIKDTRLEATFLATHGFSSQAHQSKVKIALQSYGFPDVDPQDLVTAEVASLKQASGVSKWSSVYEAISQTEDEAPGGEAFELTGVLVLIATVSLMVKRGWTAPPRDDPRPLVQLVELSVRDFGDPTHPFARIGAGLKQDECRGILLGNGCHHVPVILAHPDHPLAQSSSGNLLSPPPSILTLPPQAPANQPVDLSATLLDSLASPLPPWTQDGLSTEAVALLTDRAVDGKVTYIVVFDGSCVNNGSTDLQGVPRAGAGFSVLCHSRRGCETVVEGGAWLGKQAGSGATITNNYAELLACYLGVQALLDNLPPDLNSKPTVLITGDSKIVIDHLTGTSRLERPHLAEAAARLLALVSQVDGRYFHVLREFNERTDRLANNAVTREKSFAWQGDDWNTAHLNWVSIGRTQATSLSNPLRLLPDGQLLPVLTAAPSTTQRPPLLAHDVGWAVEQLTAAVQQSTPTLDTLKTTLVACLSVATIDVQVHMAAGGRLYKWALDQCSLRPPRRQSHSPGPSRIPVRDQQGFDSFWIATLLAVMKAREDRARHPPTYGAQQSDTGTGQRGPVLHGNITRHFATAPPPPPSTSHRGQPSASQPNPRSAPPDTRSIAATGASSPTLSQPRNSQRPPEHTLSQTHNQERDGASRDSRTPTSPNNSDDSQVWTPSSSQRRPRRPIAAHSQHHKGAPNDLTSRNHFSPLGLASPSTKQRQATNPRQTTSGTAQQPASSNHKPTPHTNKTSKRTRQSPPSSPREQHPPPSPLSSHHGHTKKPRTTASGGGGDPTHLRRTNPTSNRRAHCPKGQGPPALTTRPSDGGGRTADAPQRCRCRKSRSQHASHRTPTRPTPCVVVCGAPKWQERRMVLRHLRDTYRVRIPRETLEYRGCRGQVVLELPSASEAEELVETQHEWLSFSRYRLHLYDTSSPSLSPRSRRHWIEEMRVVQGFPSAFKGI